MKNMDSAMDDIEAHVKHRSGLKFTKENPVSRLEYYEENYGE